jgi:hypothetical protein
MSWPTNLPAPMYVRTASRVRYMGKDYIVRRNISGAIYQLIGRMTRKLPSEEAAIIAARNKKLVCQWGGYYSVYVRVDAEEAPMILEYIWAEELKRGIVPPKGDDDAAMLSDEG